jgi:DNA end-binding protein Ku
MARPIWKGHITFGLVNIPVTLFSAEVRTDLHFNMLDSRNNARVRYERVNEATGEEVPWDQIVKAFEYDDNNYVILEEEDFKRAAPESTQTVEIEDFVEQDAIEYVYFDKPYYLVPGKKGEKGYVLLRETLRRSKKVGIAKVVIRKREYLAALVPEGEMLVLELLRFHQELRPVNEFDVPGHDIEDYKISKRELEMAGQLVEAMTSTWEPAKYHDEYRDALMAWIEKKAAAGGAAPSAEASEETKEPAGEIVDFMELLKRSVEKSGKPKATRKPAPKRQPKSVAGKGGGTRKKAAGK